MKVRTIDSVIRELAETDPRKDWWRRIFRAIATGEYGLAFVRTVEFFHDNGDDYDEACAVVANAIAEHAKSQSHLANPEYIDTRDYRDGVYRGHDPDIALVQPKGRQRKNPEPLDPDPFEPM